MVYFAFSVRFGAAVVQFYAVLALLFGITRSIVYNMHHETKENFNEACITTRHSRVKENSISLAC